MAPRPNWLNVVEVVAKLTALAVLYGYLLRRGGLRYRAVVTTVVGHVMLLVCLVPLSVPMTGLAVLSSGTCCYAVLTHGRIWRRAVLIGVAHGAVLVVLLRDVPASVALAGTMPLAMLTGFMMTIRDWAVGDPRRR